MDGCLIEKDSAEKPFHHLPDLYQLIILKIIWGWESLSKTTYTPAQCAEELKKKKGWWWLYPAGRI